jgi:putative FmdB family regulatory protein
MPLYEYFCQKCDARFEQMREIEERLKTECPDCGNIARLLISRSNFKTYNPFTKDGEGFTSVTYRPEEAKYRARHNMQKEDKP